MEKFLVSVCALILPITAYAQQPSGQGEEVSLHVTIFNPVSFCVMCCQDVDDQFH